MDATEIRYDVFQALYERWVENVEAPERYVGLQGDKIIVLQPAPHSHFTILVLPSEVLAQVVAWSDRKTWRTCEDADRRADAKPPARVACPDCGTPPFTAHKPGCRWVSR